MHEWKSGFKPDFHSCILLTAGEIFVIENKKNKLKSKFLDQISEIVASDGHLPKQVLVEGLWGQQTMS